MGWSEKEAELLANVCRYLENVAEILSKSIFLLIKCMLNFVWYPGTRSWGREAPRDGVSGRPCSLAEMAIPDAVVRRHATNKVLVVEDGRRARRIPFSIAYHSLSMRPSHFIKSWLEWWLIREAAMNYGP